MAKCIRKEFRAHVRECEARSAVPWTRLFYEFTDDVVLYIQAVEIHTERFFTLLISRTVKLFPVGRHDE